MLKPVPSAAPTSLAAIAARRASEARADAQAAMQDLVRRAEEIAQEAAALASLDIAPAGVQQAAQRYGRESDAFAKSCTSIPWR